MPKEKKIKEKTLPQMEKHIEETEQEKEQIKEFTEKHIEKKPKSSMPWIILVICVLLMALGELERNRILTTIAGMGFILLVIAWIYKAIKN